MWNVIFGRMAARPLSLLILTSAGGVLPTPLLAQSDQALAPIVVEGATLAVKPSNPQPGTAAAADEIKGTGETGVPLDRIGSAVTVVTGAQLRAQQIRHAADALRSLPGVSVSRTGSFAGLTQVRLRGAEANQTLVLIDGIEANSANNGEFDFSLLSAEDIEQIEVIRGPQSGIYGSNAAGGVINIITRGGRGPLTISVKGEAGSFATTDGAVRISGGTDQAYFAGSIHQRKTGGYDVAPHGAENDGSQLGNFSFKAGAQIVRDVEVDVTLRSMKNRGERDTEGAELGMLQEQVDSPTKFTNSDFLVGARLRWSMLGGGLIHELRANKTANVITDDDPTFKARNESETTKYAYRATARFETSGLPAIKHSVTGQLENQSDSFIPLSDFADGVERTRRQNSFAGEWTGSLFGRLFLTAAARRDDSDSFKDFTTWRTAASLKLDEIGMRPHASIGTAVKAPTMYELYGSLPTFFVPNPNLLPEESEGWDAGIEFALWKRRVVFDITYFENDLTNRIDGLATHPSGNFTAVNLPGLSRRDGLETSATIELMPGLVLNAAYTHLSAFEPTGLREVRRPEHAARADLTWRFDNNRALINVGAIYNGEAFDPVRRVTGFSFGFPLLQAERFLLDDYVLVSVAASYKLQPGLEIFGRVENALDTNYQEIYGFETPRIAAYAGLRFTFEEPSTLSWGEGR